MQKADIAVIGLSVMGASIARNFESHGYSVAVFNRTYEKTKEFISGEKGKNFIPAESLEKLVISLSSPKKILMMVKAGEAVDELIEKLLPLLNKGDILIDAGNTYFKDTIRRTKKVEESGKLYLGLGVSGGEEGALLGPSLMPGGSKKAWPLLKPMLESIAAKVTDKKEPCSTWIGSDGAGHFVKMVHNGIEHADMQLISESYNLMRDVLQMTPPEIQSVFKSWNKGLLQSYLIEITADIFGKKDGQNSGYLIDKISDAAQEKGTSTWTAQTALELSVPIPTIIIAPILRSLSRLREERILAATLFPLPKIKFTGSKKEFLKALHNSLYASKIITYAQGFALMKQASQKYGWDLDFSRIAAIWRGGCIIRARLLAEIMEAYKKDSKAENLITTTFFHKELTVNYDNWKFVVSEGVKAGIALPGFTSALSYFEAYRNSSLPTNLIQAQRDYFGAHTYERII